MKDKLLGVVRVLLAGTHHIVLQVLPGAIAEVITMGCPKNMRSLMHGHDLLTVHVTANTTTHLHVDPTARHAAA